MNPAAEDTWVRVCRLDDIPALGARRVARASGLDVALFRTADDRVFALLDRCPHKGGPLSQGIVFDERVACPLHNWTIGLADGRAAEPDEGCTPTFDVLVEHGNVWLRADQLHHRATDLTRPLAGPARRGCGASATASRCDGEATPATVHPSA